MVTTTTPGGQRVTICTCTRTRHHLATFTRRPGSSLYTLAIEPPQVAASLPLVPPSPAPPCLPCAVGRQRAAPRSSFPPTTSPQQTLHMDVWGPAHFSGQSRERYFLLVVDDYTWYTTVFPLRSKGQVVDVLIPWIRTVRLQIRERFHTNLPVLRRHSDRGGEFSSDLLRDFCRGEGILQSSTSGPVSPCRRPRAHSAGRGRLAMRRCLGSGDLVSLFAIRPRTRSPPVLSPCVFLGFVPDARGWQFYPPTSRRVFPSLDVTFDESVPFYRLFPYRSAPPPLPPLFLAPGPPPLDPLLPQGPAPSGVSQVDPLPGPARVQVAVDSGAASGGATSGGAGPGGAESEVAETGGAEPGGVEPRGGEPGGTELESVEPGGAASKGAESGGGKPGYWSCRDWWCCRCRLFS
ncbi:unnamed protein product [Closterium sp. NIES-54]